MKKIFIFILVALLIPKIVFATTNANGTGTKVDFGGSSGGGESLGDKEYFLRSEHYGIRVSFYSDTGKKLGNSVDVFDYKFNYGKAIDNSFTQVTATDKYARYHAVLKSNGDLKSRIDYINEYKGYTGKMKDFIETDTKSNYIKTYDKGSLGFSATVNGYLVTTTCKGKCTQKDADKAGRLYNNDPLTYLAFDDRIYFKSYFTSSSMIERYAKLAGASEEIGMAKGNYYILIEPVFYISRLSCDENCGYYTATEIGLMYNKNNEFKNFLSSKNLSIIFYESLRLEKAGEIGNYIFGSVGNAPSKAEVSNASFLEKGYGMTLISGKEVDSYKSGKCYQIVYRTISLENPFLDANGEARTLSEESNWYRRKSVIDKDIYTNDPILVVNLTPSAIKEIRKDNKSIDYSNLNNNTYAAFYKKYKAIFSN